MTEQEKKKFVEMEKNIDLLVKAQKNNGDKLDELLDALKGNTLSGDKGLVQRILDLESEMKIYREDRTKNNIYIKIITWLIGVIAVGFIGYIISAIMQVKK